MNQEIRTEIKNYKVVDNETLDLFGEKYEIYGINKNGELFEKSLTSDEILRHTYHGVKTINDYLGNDDWFFHKEVDARNNWAHYSDFKDYDYKFQEMSKEDIKNTLMKFIYLDLPYLQNMTCVGWSGDQHPICDINLCTAHVVLNDNKRYTVFKSKDTVTVLLGDWDRLSKETWKQKAVVKFKLERDLYGKAVELSKLKRFAIRDRMNVLNADKFKRALQLQDEILEEVK